MIEETLSTWMSLLSVRAEKNAYITALSAIEKLPIREAKAFIQETLESCEDLEITYERKLEPVTLKHSCT